jgi:hypothetical protein
MKFIPLTATNETVDIKKNVVTYETDVTAGPGVIVLCDEDADKGMIIVNQVHVGGKVNIKMKPFITPARKYAKGQIVANLIVFE